MRRDVKWTVLGGGKLNVGTRRASGMALCWEPGWPSTGGHLKTPKVTLASSQPDRAKFRFKYKDGGHVQGVEPEREEGSKEEGGDGSEGCVPARRSRPNTVPGDRKGAGFLTRGHRGPVPMQRQANLTA